MIASFFTGLCRLSGPSTARQTIGIDIGTHSVKSVQVERTADGLPRIVAATSRRRSAAGAVAADEMAAIADAHKSAGFTARTAVIAAPPADALIATLDLPPRSSNAPLDQLARMELARNARLAPDAFEMAWWELPQSGRGNRITRAMAVAVAHAKSDPLLDAVESAGLEIAALDLDPAALVRGCEPALSPQGVTAILDLGAGPASLTFVLQNVTTFHRRLQEVSVGALLAELCRRLSIEHDVAEFLLGEIGVGGEKNRVRTQDGEAVELPDEGRRVVAGFVESMIRELALSFDYAAHIYPDSAVDRLLLVGGGAAMAGLPQRLGASLPVQVRCAAPVELAACDPGLLAACASPAFTLALGLALHHEAP